MEEITMADIHPVFLGALILTGVGLAPTVIIFPLWFILHRVLSKRLDHMLLKEPYFQRSEQLYCMVWPFTYWKSGIYFTLIAAPTISRRKRFKGLEEPLPVGKVLSIACKVQLWLMIFCGLTGLIWAAYLLWGAYIYPQGCDQIEALLDGFCARDV